MPTYRDEKTKTYFCKFYYKDWTGRRRQKMKRGFLRSAEAKAYERDFLNSLAAGNKITFGNLCKNYLNDQIGRLKPTTLYTNQNIIEKWLIPAFSEKPISTITPIMIREWQSGLMKNNHFAPTYLRLINTKLSAIFNYAVRYYNLPTNPVRRAGSIGNTKPLHFDFWTLAEFKTFIKGFDTENEDKDESLRLAFITFFFTGLRLGELLALTPADVDLEKKTLRINKNYVTRPKKIIQSPKTAKSNRTISIPDFLCDLLRQHIAKLYDSRQRIFFNLSKQSLTRKLRKVAAKTGVKIIRLHDLRHSHASLLIEMGFSPLVISERLGHEQVRTTLEIYAHLYPSKGTEVAEKLNSLNIVSK